jgi:ABC-type transporter Mla maintaining outer membrane lipid asymmetry ATPase subunit MlaF
MKESTPLVIDMHDMTKTYKGVTVLNSLDLHVHQNSIRKSPWSPCGGSTARNFRNLI